MYIKASTRPRFAAAFSLVEVMVATGVFSIAGLALALVFMGSIKSFAAMANYAELDRENRLAMDQITKEIRQAKQVTSYHTNGSGNTFSIRNGADQDVTYSFNADRKELRRTVSGVDAVMLTNCNLLNFTL